MPAKRSSAGAATASTREPPAAAAPAGKRQRVAKEPVYKGPRGQCFTFGDGPFGALGLGEDTTEARRPTLVPLPDEVELAAVACGGMHTVALSVDGQVYTWGVNDEGALGRPTAGSAWQDSREAKEDCNKPGKARLPAGQRAVQVAAGDGFTLALMADGSVWGWGMIKDDTSGTQGWQPGVPLQRLPALLLKPTEARNSIVKVATGARHALMLTRRGEVLSFGMGGQGQLGRLPPYDNSSYPPLEQLLGLAEVPGVRASIGGDIVDIAAGAYTSFAINRHGDVAAWGLNSAAQLGMEPTGGEGGTFLWHPQHVPSMQGVAAVAGGEKHTLVLTKKREVLACGDPNYGQLGNGQEGGAVQPEPRPVLRPEQLAEETITALAAGLNVSGCITKEGNMYLWGSNTNGQMAKGMDDTDCTAPTRTRRTAAFGHRPVLQLSFGGQHAALLAGADPGPPQA